MVRSCSINSKLFCGLFSCLGTEVRNTTGSSLHSTSCAPCARVAYRLIPNTIKPTMARPKRQIATNPTVEIICRTCGETKLSSTTRPKNWAIRPTKLSSFLRRAITVRFGSQDCANDQAGKAPKCLEIETASVSWLVKPPGSNPSWQSLLPLQSRGRALNCVLLGGEEDGLR